MYWRDLGSCEKVFRLATQHANWHVKSVAHSEETKPRCLGLRTTSLYSTSTPKAMSQPPVYSTISTTVDLNDQQLSGRDPSVPTQPPLLQYAHGTRSHLSHYLEIASEIL